MFTIELKRQIAEACDITVHAVRRSMQKGGQPLSRHHREKLVELFGVEVADRICPARERARKGEKPRPKPAWADVLARMDAQDAKIEQLAAKVRFLEVEQIASLFDDVGQIEARLDALETARMEASWKEMQEEET